MSPVGKCLLPQYHGLSHGAPGSLLYFSKQALPQSTNLGSTAAGLRDPSVIRLLRTFSSAGHLQATGNGTQTSACSSPLAECGARSLRRVLGHGQGVSGKGISFSLPSVPPLCTPCATGSRFLSPSCPTLMIDSLFPWPLPPWPSALYPSPLTPCPQAVLV